MKRIVVFVLAMLIMPLTALAEGTAFQPPKPGPEHQKLAGLVGNWTSEGECKENPIAPVEKWSAKLKSEWYPGNFAVVRRLESKGTVSGEAVGLEVITYDSQAKVHTWYGIDSTGWTAMGKGSISKGVFKVTWPVSVKGKAYKVRGILKGLGSDKLLWSVDYSEDGKTWTTICTATDVRVKAN
jgi:hypothetical protein